MRDAVTALTIGAVTIAVIVGGFFWLAHVAAVEAAKRDAMAEILFDQCSEDGGSLKVRVGDKVSCFGDDSETIWTREVTD